MLLPDVLSNPKLIKPGDYNGLDRQAAFEDASTLARRPKVKFNIDNTYCFPTSLAFARRGIN
jgi:hypothetical protein